MKRTDEQIKVDIVKQLDWNTSVDASNVKVEVSNGKAVLTGSVNFYANKRAAENSTWLIPTVKEVDNRIVVKYPTSIKIPTDGEIKKNAEHAILWDSDVFSLDIDVSVSKGEVILKGTVDAYWKKLHTETIVESILGVTNVVNKLAVVPTDSYSDRIVAENIVSAIDRLSVADAQDIDVKVIDGVVTLSGSVSSWISKRAIENAAEYTAGVINVTSLLTINY